MERFSRRPVLPASIERFNPTRLSIKWKVFVPVAGTVIAAFLVYSFVGLRAAETQLLEKTDRSATALAEMAERVLRPSLLKGDDATVRRLLSDLKGMPDVADLRIVRPDGSLWSDGATGKNAPRLEIQDLRRRALRSRSGVAGDMTLDWIYHVVRVVRRTDRRIESPPIGYLEMDLEMADTRERILNSRMQLAFIGIITLFVLAAALMIPIKVLVSEPLDELTDAMERVESGDLKARADIRSGDELERLGGSFNRMIEEIDHKNKQLTEAGQQILRSEKLASIGLLAAGVAHEINNPVATISMSAEGLLETEPVAERQRFLRVIIEESERIGAIVRNLLGFEKGGHTAYEERSLTQIVQEAEKDLRREAERANVAVTTDLHLSRDRIMGQSDQLRQAFLNIMDNALRAMDDGGRLDITGEATDDRATIRFRDTGPGISQEHQERIFDPFFTTREVGEGFGLGLAVCYDIIKRHNGDISVQSGPEGTTFTIELPLIEEEKRGENQPESAAGRRR
jgi:signal transduction histidine kinase